SFRHRAPDVLDDSDESFRLGRVHGRPHLGYTDRLRCCHLPSSFSFFVLAMVVSKTCIVQSRSRSNPITGVAIMRTGYLLPSVSSVRRMSSTYHSPSIWMADPSKPIPPMNSTLDMSMSRSSSLTSLP